MKGAESLNRVTHLLHRVSALRATLDELMPAIARHSAPEFSPFEFVRKDELGLSKIIRWLFDPKGTHGQGGLFLKAFIAALGQGADFEKANCADAVVVCEAVTTLPGQENRRIDILVRIGSGPDGYCLAIENKPWAAWQERQLEAYLDDISQTYQVPDRRRIVALKGWQGEAEPDQLAADKRSELIDTDYGTFADILRSTVTQCEAENVRRFLEQFISFIDQAFGGRKMSMLTNQISSQILDDPALTKPAFELLNSRGDLLAEVASRFERDVKIAADQSGLCCRSEGSLLNSSNGIEFTLPGELMLRFRLSFNRGLDGAYWGLPGQGNELHVGKKAILVAHVKERSTDVLTSDGWIWWQKIDVVTEFNDNPALWLAMLDGTLARRVVAEAVVTLRRDTSADRSST